jgi:hypothetical protein
MGGKEMRLYRNSEHGRESQSKEPWTLTSLCQAPIEDRQAGTHSCPMCTQALGMPCPPLWTRVHLGELTWNREWLH